MARQDIGQGWTLDLPDEFAARRDDKRNHVVRHGDRTVYAVVFRTTGGEAEAALAEMIDSRGVRPLERFAHRDDGVAADAWLTPEEDPHGRTYFGLNTYTASGERVACVTVYFPIPADLPWALALWRTVRPPAAVIQHG